MSAAEKRAQRLIYALRGVEIDDTKAQFIGWAGQMWSDDAIEVCSSMLELVREAGFLRREREERSEAVFVHKQPGDWGWATSSGGAAYTGRNGDTIDNADDA